MKGSIMAGYGKTPARRKQPEESPVTQRKKK